MTTVADIIAQRDAAIAVIDKQIVAANDLKNAGTAGMNDKINTLEQQVAAIAAQSYMAALNDPAMTQALAALTTATQQMNDVAQNMITATAFITNFNNFITATNKVIPALKGIIA